MKKRIFSLLLALVMVFSCMSLSIFATEPPDAQAASEEKTIEATEIPCKDAASILGDDLVFAADFDILTGGSLISGKYETKEDAEGNKYILMTGSTIISGFEIRQNASYVVSFDIKIDLDKASDDGTYYAFNEMFNVDSSTQGMWPVAIDGASGNLMYQRFVEVKANGTCDRRNTNTGIVMEKDKFYRIDLVHRPSENVYDIYVNGELIIANETATSNNNFTLSKLQLDKNNGVISYDNIKVYYAETNLECKHSMNGDTCEWCGRSFKTNAGSHTHTISKTPAPADKIACTDAAQVLGDDLVLSIDFDNITKEDVSSSVFASGAMEMHTFDDNKWGYMKGNNYIYPPAGKTAASYVISFDFRTNGGECFPFYDMRSSTGGKAMWPLKFYQGTFYHTDGATGNYIPHEDITIENNKSYNIVFLHTPATNTFKVWIDGKLVVNNAPASNTTNFTVSSILLDTKGTGWIDNIKMYYADTNLECAHSFSTSATCDWCGKTCEGFEFAACDVCNGSVVSEGAAVVEKSVSINEKIDMNVYMAISDELINNANAKVVLECGHRSAEYALADAVAEENGLYKFSIGLTSAQMAEDVKVKVVGEISNTYTTTVKAYAEELIASGASDSAKQLAKAMLNYGAASQVYFAKWNGDAALDDVLANAGLDEADKVVIDVTGKAGFNNVNYAPVTEGEDVEFTAATMMFSSKTHINVFFKASDEAIVTVDGKQVVPNASEYRGEYYVTFTVDSPADIMEGIQIVVTDGESMAAQEFSAALLIKVGVASDELDDSFKDLLKAYAYYAMCAATYVA